MHSGTEYWVAALGFWPGLCSLMPLDPRHRLNAPKYNPPRTWTPKGTIGHGGAITCIYPDQTPGGYQIFARTPMPIWDREQRLAAFKDSLALFKAGDRVRFVPIDRAEWDEIDAKVSEGTYRHPNVDYQKFSISRYRAWLAEIAPASGEPLVRGDRRPGLETSRPGPAWPHRLLGAGVPAVRSGRHVVVPPRQPARRQRSRRGGAGVPVSRADAEIPARRPCRRHRRRHGAHARRRGGAALEDDRRAPGPGAGAERRQDRRAELHRVCRRHRHAAGARLALDLPYGGRRRRERICLEGRAAHTGRRRSGAATHSGGHAGSPPGRSRGARVGHRGRRRPERFLAR